MFNPYSLIFKSIIGILIPFVIGAILLSAFGIIVLF